MAILSTIRACQSAEQPLTTPQSTLLSLHLLVPTTPLAVFPLCFSLAFDHFGRTSALRATTNGAVAATATTTIAMLAFVVEATKQCENQGAAALTKLDTRRALPIVHANCVGQRGGACCRVALWQWSTRTPTSATGLTAAAPAASTTSAPAAA